MLEKINQALKLIFDYRKTIQEEWKERESILNDLKKEIKDQEAKQHELHVVKQVSLFSILYIYLYMFISIYNLTHL